MSDEAFDPGEVQLMQQFFAYPSLIAKSRAGLNNVWSDNTYTWTGGAAGAWQFWAGNQGNKVSWSTWRNAYGQDAGSRSQS
jgi:hypothetical protein